VLQELQVETFGSMEKREKTDFILEQMRLCLGELDYSRTLLLSKKIHSKFFQVVENQVYNRIVLMNQDLLLRFCKLMITHALAASDFLAVAKYYGKIYATNEVKDTVAEWTPVLENMVLYTCLAPFDNEQSDMINRVYLDANLTTIPLYKYKFLCVNNREFVKCFITKELIRWSAVTEIYAAFRKGAALSSSDVKGVERWGALKMRVTEHNIRVVSGYYNCITDKRLGELLDLPGSEVELRISDLVSKGTIWAKIDRVEGVVTFEKPSGGVEDVLNVWSGAVGGVLGLIGKTGHLISKEEIAARVFV
jgi:26S proteasome regulatory subunit N5